MTTDAKSQAANAARVYAEGQALTDAWHARMADLDARAPRKPAPAPPLKDGVSPLGGLRPWFTGKS